MKYPNRFYSIVLYFFFACVVGTVLIKIVIIRVLTTILITIHFDFCLQRLTSIWTELACEMQ